MDMTKKHNKDGYGYGQKFPVCDGVLNSMENNFGESTRHWIDMLKTQTVDKDRAITELALDSDGRELLDFLCEHQSIEDKILRVLKRMKDK